jgi:hypothetical protein
MAAQLIFFRQKAPAEDRLDAQQLKQMGTNAHPANVLGAIALLENEPFAFDSRPLLEGLIPFHDF